MPARSAAAVIDIRSRDADRSREQILRAAMAEFADNGYGGGRIDAIAERAGVNKKLIYYYFEGKDELFLAVLEQTYADIRAAERALHLEAGDPVLAIRKLVGFTWRHYIEHPEFLALLNSENLLRGQHVKRSHRVQEMSSPLIAMLATLLERGQRTGVFRADVDPLQLYVSIAGLAYFYLSNNHTLSAIFGRGLMSPEALDERLQHITEVVVGYLSAASPPKGH